MDEWDWDEEEWSEVSECDDVGKEMKSEVKRVKKNEWDVNEAKRVKKEEWDMNE